MKSNAYKILAYGPFLLLVACAANPGYIGETRTAESIQMAFEKKSRHDIREVYSKALKSNPGLFGKIIFRVTIAADGEVVHSDVVESTLIEPSIIPAINRIIYGTNFGRVRNPDDITFMFPIELVPG